MTIEVQTMIKQQYGTCSLRKICADMRTSNGGGRYPHEKILNPLSTKTRLKVIKISRCQVGFVSSLGA